MLLEQSTRTILGDEEVEETYHIPLLKDANQEDIQHREGDKELVGDNESDISDIIVVTQPPLNPARRQHPETAIPSQETRRSSRTTQKVDYKKLHTGSARLTKAELGDHLTPVSPKS